MSTQSNTNTSVTVHQRGNIQKTYTTHMQSRDTGGRSLSDGRGGSVVALGEGPKRCVLPESQQPGEASSRGNDAVPLCYFTWLLIENTGTSYRETFTSAFGSIQRALDFKNLSCFTPQRKGGEKGTPSMAELPKTGGICAEAWMDPERNCGDTDHRLKDHRRRSSCTSRP